MGEDDDLEMTKYDEGEVAVNEEDELAVRMFMKPNRETRTRTLGDIINEKMTEKKTEIQSQFSDGTELIKDINPDVSQMYTEVGVLLTRYRSGKVPKAFKMLPQFRNWEQLLYLTQPEQWSAAAMYQATRIFTSNLKEKMAQRFFNLILLPRCYIRIVSRLTLAKYSSPRLVVDRMEELIAELLLVENVWCQKQSWSFMYLLCSGMVGFGLRRKLGTAVNPLHGHLL